MCPSPLPVQLLFCCGNASAQAQRIAETQDHAAPRWSADPVDVIPDGFNRSVALNGIRQIQDLGHGIVLDVGAVLGVRYWTRMRPLIQICLSLRLSFFLRDVNGFGSPSDAANAVPLT